MCLAAKFRIGHASVILTSLWVHVCYNMIQCDAIRSEQIYFGDVVLDSINMVSRDEDSIEVHIEYYPVKVRKASGM